MFKKAAMRLYKARLAREQARKDFSELREEKGYCLFATEKDEKPCWQWPDEEPCDNCKESQPIYLRREAAAREVGAALRSLMHLCKKEAAS